MALKSYNCSLKSVGEAGTGTAVFATMQTVDKDGDLTLPGAFGNQMAKLVGAHDWSAPPIGIAKIYESGNQALADFRFNLEMPSAVEWYKAVKWNFDHGVPQEYSYGFDVLKHSFRDIGGKQVRVLEKMKVHEVSPVMVGAGIDTQTLSMKSCASCGSKHDDHGQTVESQFEGALSGLGHLNERLESIKHLRHGEGRKKLISESSMIRFMAVKHQFRLLEQWIQAEPLREDARELFDKYQRTSAKIDIFLRR